MLTGELNIGITYSFSTVMSETVVEFLRAYPGVKLNICYQTMEELMGKLKRRELDFVLAFKPLKMIKILIAALFSVINLRRLSMKTIHCLGKSQLDLQN